MSKTIIISNRLPVQLQISDGGLSAKPSVGGLATGMKVVVTFRDQEGQIVKNVTFSNEDLS